MRALAGLFMLGVMAVAGLGTYTGQVPFAAVLVRGLAVFESKGAEASTDKPATEAAAQGPRSIRIITQTVAVSDQAPVAAASSLPVASAPIAPTETGAVAAQVPMTVPAPAGVGGKGGKVAAHKHSSVKTAACAAGQHLDRVRHKCAGAKHSSSDPMPKPLG